MLIAQGGAHGQELALSPAEIKPSVSIQQRQAFRARTSIDNGLLA